MHDISMLISQYSNTVFKLALSMVKNPHDAQDITQEVFLRYIKYHVAFFNQNHEKAWFIRATINQSKSFLTSSWKKRAVLTDTYDSQFTSNNVEQDIDVLTAVLNLPENERICVHLFYYEQLTAEQISKFTGMKINTVKSHLHRARLSLKDTLKGEYDI